MAARIDERRDRPTRMDREFRVRYLLRNMVLAVPAIVALWTTAVHDDATRWIAGSFFVVWIGGWVLADRAWSRRYRCPSCRTTIRKPTLSDRNPGDSISYYCEKCALEWDTGLRESDG